eukprot:CAMPEP_0174291814 /NCGR_PEP_ID=MMETSP0809-20121228/33303_1 /TAXON_ID=73025 ORGANISM="Eutreptiella gymnastica-like, Strain CCMP1594" /NCGR_SAMPLE_ID=MMETSP0809 /ASSEMBLY_ACC=CAM_ASM_000658 /LENGTH=337 /DNA_ID=CAMNT_0015391423 /DNA_START=35 /DNA_END=1046 /DNA_ORIENTATION=-
MSLPASLVSPPQTPPSWPRRFSQPALTVTPPWPLKTAPAARPRRHTSSASGIRSPAALSTTASPCFDVGNSPKGNIIGLPRTDSTEALRQSLQTYKFASQPAGPCAVGDDVKAAPIHGQGWSARRAAPPPPQLVVEDTEDRRPPSLSPGSSASPSPCSSALDSPSAQSGASRRRSSSGSLPRRPSTLSPLCDADDGRPSWSPGSSVGPSPAGSALNPPAAEGVASRRGSGSRPSPRRPSTLSPAKGQCGFPLTALEAGGAELHAGPGLLRGCVPPLVGLRLVSPSLRPSLQQDAHRPRCCLMPKERNASEGAVQSLCTAESQEAKRGILATSVCRLR